MVAKRKAIRSSESKSSTLKMVVWGLVMLILKVLGIAFLIQGFVLQLATGVLYYGLLHYAIGVILMFVGWHLHKKNCSMCNSSCC